MRFPGLGPLRAAHARGRLLPALVAVAVAVVLVEGAWRGRQRQPATPETSLPLASPGAPAPRGDLDKAPLSYAADYYLQVGERARNRLVLVGATRLPAIVLKPGLAVAASEAAEQVTRLAWQQRFREERARVAGQGAQEEATETGTAAATLITMQRELGLAILELPAPKTAPEAFRTPNPPALRPGAFVAAVSLTPDRRLRIVPGHLVSRPALSEPLELSLALPPALRTAAVVDLDSAVLGILFESGGEQRVLAAARVLEQAQAARDAPGCRAFEVSDLPASEEGASRGLRVERVAAGAFASQPAPRAGDVLLEWDGRAVKSAEEFQRQIQALPAWALADFGLVRAGRRLRARVTLPARDCAPGPEPPLLLPRLGLLCVRSGDAGWSVLEVAPASPANEAGLRSGDLILEAERLRGRLARGRLEGYEVAPRRLALGVRRGGETLALVVAAGHE